MIKLDKTKSYYLGDLSKEQREEILVLASENYNNFGNMDDTNKKHLMYMYYGGNHWTCRKDRQSYTDPTNALELFYTLENVQVDCRELSEEHVKEMCKVYESNGFKVDYGHLKVDDEYIFLMFVDYDVWVYKSYKNKHTITYDKFMELFSKEEENVLTEIMKDEYKPTFCETYKSEKPQHYSKGIDTFKRMEENCTLEERLAFAKGNIDKYTWRTKGQDKEDFVKIVKYAEWALKQLENEQSTK